MRAPKLSLLTPFRLLTSPARQRCVGLREAPTRWQRWRDRCRGDSGQCFCPHSTWADAAACGIFSPFWTPGLGCSGAAPSGSVGVNEWQAWPRVRQRNECHQRIFLRCWSITLRPSAWRTWGMQRTSQRNARREHFDVRQGLCRSWASAGSHKLRGFFPHAAVRREQEKARASPRQ